MVIFASEQDLLQKLSEHDELVRKCVAAEISFAEFCDRYNDFHALHALDGHESDEDERALLKKHERRIAPHRVIAKDILGRLCSEADAMRDVYRQAGRFGAEEGLRRLAMVELAAAS